MIGAGPIPRDQDIYHSFRQYDLLRFGDTIPIPIHIDTPTQYGNVNHLKKRDLDARHVSSCVPGVHTTGVLCEVLEYSANTRHSNTQ